LTWDREFAEREVDRIDTSRQIESNIEECIGNEEV
jgi:hypothetical protein